MEEILPVFWPYYTISLSLAIVLGMVAQRSRFCLQGGLRDWLNLKQSDRLVTYAATISFAILAATLAEAFSLVSLDMTKPAYRSSELALGRYVIGGFIFGVGMILCAGCGFRQVIKSGEGNLKAIWALGIMALTIYLITRGEFFGTLLMPLFAPMTVSLNAPQDIGSLVSPDHAGTLRLSLALIFSGYVCWQLLKRKTHLGTWFTTISIGVAIALGFIITGGEYAQFLAEEAEFMTTPPTGLGGQSFTVAAPLGDVVYFLTQLSLPSMTFGVLAIAGLILGAFTSALLGKRFAISGFASNQDFLFTTLGAALAGFGAVIATGCSVGHGLTGIATLSIGSIMAFAAMIAGGLVTIKLTRQVG